MGAVIRGIRLLVVAAVLTGVLTACSVTVETGSSASCAATLKFRGQVYGGTSLRTHPPYDRIGRIPAAHMHEIGSGELPPCNDTNDAHDPAQQVRVARIDGVDPQVAVAVFPDGSVYLRPAATLPRALVSAPWIRWTESD